MLTFDKRYFTLALALFVVEVLIALYVDDKIVRPYVGDFLVVILIYCAIRTFIKTSPLKVTVAVLLFAYTLELLQYFKIVKILGLQHNKIASTIIGTGFAWIDLVAYTLGALAIILLERRTQMFRRSGTKQIG